jgi:peptidoglycan L-alanyl-D-glutamate endopeptidase CwlK
MKLGAASLLRLEGVHPDLVRVVHKAIELTAIDFTVTEGLRTVKRQEELFKAGASTTMNSRHLTGHAVDIAALVGGKVRWDWPLYFQLADAMKEAAKLENVKIKWGGVWDKTIDEYDSPEDETTAYIVRKKAEFKKKGVKRSPFVDGPHFELA